MKTNIPHCFRDRAATAGHLQAPARRWYGGPRQARPAHHRHGQGPGGKARPHGSMPVRLWPPVSRTAACTPVGFDGMRRNDYHRDW